ncbi:MAG: hypothetical protein HN922_09090 [Anaerolineae bacterium]|jgi:hypothetical protein|nr:hypothetical protein [Anaerolineae bacterium]MBT7782840.1 hypothetical protein [Anaerolineae bacterium]
MPKTFYTERDIEDMVRQGISSLAVDDNAVLTDLAYTRAHQLGLVLISDNDKPPAAPERPYIAKSLQAPVKKKMKKAAPLPVRSVARNLPPSSNDGLHERIHAAVVAKLGSSVDAKLLDVIIKRVLRNINTN